MAGSRRGRHDNGPVRLTPAALPIVNVSLVLRCLGVVDRLESIDFGLIVGVDLVIGPYRAPERGHRAGKDVDPKTQCTEPSGSIPRPPLPRYSGEKQLHDPVRVHRL